jgi:hypothetical protein
MQRKHFLKQAALTLPAALLSPQLILAEEKKQTTTVNEAMVLIEGDEDMAPCEALLQVKIKRLSLQQVTTLQYQQGRFIITTNNGKVFSTCKLALQGVTTHLEQAPLQHLVLTGANSTKLRYGHKMVSNSWLSLTSHQLPQLWLHKARQLDAHFITQYLNKERAAVLQII